MRVCQGRSESVWWNEPSVSRSSEQTFPLRQGKLRRRCETPLHREDVVCHRRGFPLSAFQFRKLASAEAWDDDSPSWLEIGCCDKRIPARASRRNAVKPKRNPTIWLTLESEMPSASVCYSSCAATAFGIDLNWQDCRRHNERQQYQRRTAPVADRGSANGPHDGESTLAAKPAATAING